MNNGKARIGAWTAAALAAGCVAGPYQQPDGPQTARLTVMNQSGDVVAPYTFQNAETCSGKLALHPRAGVSIGDAYTVRIAGGAPFTLSAEGTNAPPNSFGSTGGSRCSVAGTFVPQPGKTYLAIYRGTGAQCQLQVGERADGGVSARYFPVRGYRDREDCR